MSSNAFHLQKATLEEIKAAVKSREIPPKLSPTKLSPTLEQAQTMLEHVKNMKPAQEPLDEFDEFDEMFLKLNNALIEKHDQLVEKEEELKKKEEELEKRAIEVDNDESEVITARKQYGELVKLRKENKNLDDKLAEQEELEVHLRNKIFEKNYSTPWIMYEIPPANGSTNLRFITCLNKLGSKEIYSQTQSIIYQVDKRLRELYARAKADHDEDKQIKIAAAYYVMSFSYETYKEIAETLAQYISFIDDLNDTPLSALAKELRDKPLTRIRDLAKG